MWKREDEEVLVGRGGSFTRQSGMMVEEARAEGGNGAEWNEREVAGKKQRGPVV